jgi:small multidrug resistance pump
MSWLFLGVAIILEVCGTTCMKLSDGLSRLLPSILIFVFYAGAFTLLPLAVKHIDLSAAYAIWSGVGTALTAAIGIGYFKESISTTKILCLLLVIVGVVGLKLAGDGHGQ